MTASFRFSWLRPSGWNRLGVTGAVGVLFGTPMLWALGVFGAGPEALRAAGVFLLSGVWFCIAVCSTIGWAIKGFTVRVKGGEAEDEDARDAPPRASTPLHRPAH